MTPSSRPGTIVDITNADPSRGEDLDGVRLIKGWSIRWEALIANDEALIEKQSSYRKLCFAESRSCPVTTPRTDLMMVNVSIFAMVAPTSTWLTRDRNIWLYTPLGHS